ncbi:MAG: L-threonylcarbamoyladenylate synthase [Anaerolineales bacterium]
MITADDPHAIDRATQTLQAGGLLAFPTDTVYGLAAHLLDPASIDRLYAVKDRDSTKAIPVLLSSPDELAQVTAEMNVMALRLARRFWPGPLTLVVPRHPSLPDNLSNLPTIGVRMPDHPLALALMRRTGPLAVTSANLSGAENTRTAQEVYAQLGGRIELILDGGRTPGGFPSTVVDCTAAEPAILRQGPITAADLQQALAK